MPLNDQELIQVALDWCGDHPDFDSAFVDSLGESHRRFGHLTDRQREALESMVRKFRMLEDD